MVDCYYPAAAEAILLIVGLKNVFGFGFSYSVIPWLTAWGYRSHIRNLCSDSIWRCLVGVAPLVFWQENQACDGKMEDNLVVVQIPFHSLIRSFSFQQVSFSYLFNFGSILTLLSMVINNGD